MVDAHAHLDDRRFAPDRDAVVQRALDAGVAAIVTAGSDLDSSATAVRLAEAFPMVYAAVGFHPHEASRFRPEDLAQLRAWCSHPKVVAVGEIGLDYYFDHSPREVQRRVFETHLDLAAEVGLPVVVHCRDAWAVMEETLRAWSLGLHVRGRRPEGRASDDPEARPSGRQTNNPELPVGSHPPAGPPKKGMLHCFSGDAALAGRLAALGFCISLAGPVTFTNARQLPEVARTVPLNALLVETDSPYLTPHPYRGQRNEPARVAVTAQRVAELRGMELAALAQATNANAARLFGLPLPGLEQPARGAAAS